MRESEREPRLQFHCRRTYRPTEAIEAAAGHRQRACFLKKREKECPKLSYVHPGPTRRRTAQASPASQPASSSRAPSLWAIGGIREGEGERERPRPHSQVWDVHSLFLFSSTLNDIKPLAVVLGLSFSPRPFSRFIGVFLSLISRMLECLKQSKAERNRR